LAASTYANYLAAFFAAFLPALSPLPWTVTLVAVPTLGVAHDALAGLEIGGAGDAFELGVGVDGDGDLGALLAAGLDGDAGGVGFDDGYP